MHRSMRLRLSLGVMASAVFCLSIQVASAAGGGSEQGKHLGQEKKSNDDDGEQGEHGHGKGHGSYRFEAHEREIISGYYANQSQGLPPGLAKRGGSLPPGLEKQLARNGTLPPGLQKRLEPLPVELERRLPPLPTDCGCHRGIIGTSVVLVRAGDYLVLDLVHVSGG